MKKFLQDKTTRKIFKYFLGWRILLFFFLFLALKYVPLQSDFLGGGLKNYLSDPWLWSFVNFDGEHYLALARDGYKPLTYFFFPVYPLLTRYIAEIFGKDFIHYVYSGLFVSHVSFLFALLGFWKIILLDHKEKIAKYAIFLLLLFPTSFYFASFYTESLFLALVIWSFYFARKGNFLLAGLLGAISTATRVVGVALFPAILVEAYLQRKKDFNKKIFYSFLIPLGIFFYMYFLKVKTGDPLEFFNSIGIFGPQRSAGFVLLPQVFYRYFFKILPNLNYSYLPTTFTPLLELLTALLFLGLSVFSFFKQRLSYALFLAAGYLIPTFSGSFSSLPRYVLILFPAFILSAVYVKKLPKVLQALVFAILFICLGVATLLFVRGFWVA